jgi:molybdopterin synthase catalytic subunit
MITVSIQQEGFDPGALLSSLEALGSGAVASFTGLVRNDDGVTAMTLEHYPGMTQTALTAIAEDASSRWALDGIVITHRVGRLLAGERIVFVGVASPHRAEALSACAFIIDRLKTDAPFWKKEETEAGERWVEARVGDEERAKAWDQ